MGRKLEGNIHQGVFAGQDFSFHVGCTNRLLGRPGEWFTQDVTNRPLIYWIAIDGRDGTLFMYRLPTQTRCLLRFARP